MRRLALGLILLAVCALSAVAALLVGRCAVPIGSRVAGRALAVAGRALVGKAFAGEAMEFHTVPPESARALERVRHRAHKGITIESGAPASPGAPSTAETPEAPESPAAPEPADHPSVVVHGSGRSGDMMRIGQDIHIENGQTVTGDVVAMGGDIVVDGHVEGDVQAMGGDVYLNSSARVDGDVFCMGGALHEQPGSVVGGQRVTALGPKGKHWSRVTRVRDEDTGETRHHRWGHRIGALLWALIGIGVAWGFFTLGPGRSGAALARVRSEAGASLMVGLLTALVFVPGFIAVALLAAILCITLIGIPVAIVLLLAYPSVVALLWVWGFAVGAAVLGQRINAARTPAAVPGGVAAPGAPVQVGAAGLAGSAALGALLICGALFFGGLLRSLSTFGPLDALATLVLVIGWITFAVLSTLGAGALVRHELAHGPLHRWWTGRQNGGATPPPSAPAPVAPAPPAAPSAPAEVPPPPEPAPSPPVAFMPPGGPPPAP